MDLTPERPSMADPFSFGIAEDADDIGRPVKRLKKPPPITPRRFTKFFEPRPRSSRHAVRTSRAALQDITGAAVNRAGLESTSFNISLQSNCLPSSSTRQRAGSFSSLPSLMSSPLQGCGAPSGSPDLYPALPTEGERSAAGTEQSSVTNEDKKEDNENDSDNEECPPLRIIRRYRTISSSASLLSSRISGRRTVKEAWNSQIWQDHTANFYSEPADVYTSTSSQTHMQNIPFCAASCKTNSLVAIGNEEGAIELVDSSPVDKDGFSRMYLRMKPHENAIMDLEFSEDDALIATASGDQTSQVIDMQTQTSLYCLSGHHASIKQVKFQPGSGRNLLATCSRDGCVNFWDLRCRTFDRPSLHLRSSANSETSMIENMKFASLTKSLRETHAATIRKTRKPSHPGRSSQISSRFDFSVTSLSFLGESRSNMIVTASEADAVVKLWDMRTSYSSKKGRPTPVSSTREPKSHAVHRRFGLTSLALSGDGARLYALCRDHTVYAYATSHLLLGDAPEMALQSSHAFRSTAGSSEQGLGPLYGFRHPRLRISTFYPKLAIRKAGASNTELLAVASSDECPILFSTNERYLTRTTQTGLRPPPLSNPIPVSTSSMLSRQPSFSILSRSHVDDDMPIYHHGTPLIRGHRKEVTAVSWTSEGCLVTSSDDLSTRCWREDGHKARDLRKNGEVEGRRWNAGWAEVSNLEFDD